LVNFAVIAGCEDDLSQVIVSCLDISEQKKALIEVEENKRNLQAIFDNTLVSFLLIDKNYQIMSYNATACERAELFFGKPIKPGDSIWLFVRDGDRDNLRRDLSRALSGENIRAELEFESNEGRSFWFEFHFSPVYEVSGEINRVFFTAQDVTEQKDLKASLRKYEEERLILAHESSMNSGCTR